MNRRSFFGWLTGVVAAVTLPLPAAAKPDRFIGTRRVVNNRHQMEPVFMRDSVAYCEDWEGKLSLVGPNVPRAEYRDVISGRIYTKPMTDEQLKGLTA